MSGNDRSHANGNGGPVRGNSFANGDALPVWLRRNWEFREIFEARFCSWTVMA